MISLSSIQDQDDLTDTGDATDGDDWTQVCDICMHSVVSLVVNNSSYAVSSFCVRLSRMLPLNKCYGIV